MAMDPTIYILLPVYNRKKITLEFIAQLKRQSVQSFSLILIDDGSTDGTSEEARELLANVTVLKGSNLWWAGALQMGINYLKNKNISPKTPLLIINDDTSIPENFIEIGISLLNENPDTFICASVKNDNVITPSTVHINWEKFLFETTKEETSNCLPTRGLFLKFGDMLAVGEFYPRLLPHYFSDYEFTHRAYKSGVKLFSPKELWLEAMPMETGIRALQGRGISYLRKLFSKRYTNNPYYTAIFILLAAPRGFKLTNLRRLIIKTARQIARNVILRSIISEE